jgi:hypothetical protein
VIRVAQTNYTLDVITLSFAIMSHDFSFLFTPVPGGRWGASRNQHYLAWLAAPGARGPVARRIQLDAVSAGGPLCSSCFSARGNAPVICSGENGVVVETAGFTPEEKAKAWRGDAKHRLFVIEALLAENFTQRSVAMEHFISNAAQRAFLDRYPQGHRWLVKLPPVASDHTYGTLFELLWDTEPEFVQEYSDWLMTQAPFPGA